MLIRMFIKLLYFMFIIIYQLNKCKNNITNKGINLLDPILLFQCENFDEKKL